MNIDPSGDVPAAGQGAEQQPQVSAAQQAQQSAEGRVTERVFAMLMSIMGSFSNGIMNHYLPILEKERTWEGAATGIYNIFNSNPGSPPDYKKSTIGDQQWNQFAKGFQFLKWAYDHPKSKEWTAMPPNMQSWATAVMTSPIASGPLNKLYSMAVELQRLENKGAPTTALRHQMLKAVIKFQAHGVVNKKDPKISAEFDSLKQLTQTTVSAMSAMSTLTYSQANGVILKISSLTKYASSLIAHEQTVKSGITRNILS